jgi:3',5'-cyclic-AMP phosphodiesterase
MSHRILHLSDTHLTATGLDADGVDAAASLKRILFDARYLDGLDLVIVIGDIADDRSAAGYAAARRSSADSPLTGHPAHLRYR